MAGDSDSPVTTISSDSPSEPQAEGIQSSRLDPVENTIKVLLPLPLGDAYDYRVPEGMPLMPAQIGPMLGRAATP